MVAASLAGAARLQQGDVMQPSNQFPETYELRFNDLFVTGRGFAFPCDAHGRVDLDALSEHARENYLYARALVGQRTSLPMVCPLSLA